jgi:saccharopine dehydrogenase-like NADP-dependent oxidoreductase
MKKVAMLGAGLVSEPLAEYLMDDCAYDVVIATRTPSKAEKIINGRKNGRAMAWVAEQHDELDNLVREVDLVVSMIPPTMHIPVAKACLRHRKHLVTTSYISPEMQALDAEARDLGVVLMNEVGEDPGLDHMGAKAMIDQARREGGRVTALASYGAGLPSFEHNRNAVNYKFSWSPRGVMLAAQTSAAYIQEGQVIEVPAHELFSHHWLVDIEGLGTFETYPNRSCLRYLPHFDLEENASLYRGLLRFVGWCNFMKSLVALKYLDGRDKQDLSGKTFREFTAGLMGRPDATTEILAAFLDVPPTADEIMRLEWLGILDDTPIPLTSGASVDVLITLMLARMSYQPGETDMIIVHDEIVVEFGDRKERRLSTLHVEGATDGTSAMSRAVSLPAAIAARLILEGKLNAPGVQMPLQAEIYEPILERLGHLGFTFRHQTLPESNPEA